ncbi:MAG: ATP-binding protein [Deltaproteobacteria bacterium]|nr:ATP-binding protein [Deltaproteobacteria bacterium]
MKPKINVWLAWDHPALLRELEAALEDAPFTIAHTCHINELPVDLVNCHLVIVDQSQSVAPATLRLYSLCEANPETIVLVVVNDRNDVERELLGAGVFAVLDSQTMISRELLAAAAAAERLLAMQQKQKQMSANLAHQDKIAAIGVLAAGVSHEVNNPCAAILSNVSSLREDLEALMRRPRAQRLQALDAFAAEAMAAFSDCIGAGHRIADIVNTLNLFSRKEDTSELVSIDVNHEVQMVLRLLGREVKYQASFTVELGQDLPKVTGPRNSLAQVLTNLVVNALDATAGMSKSNRKIWIKTVCDAEYVVLQVGDNGPGIDLELAPRVFDPFFTTKAHGEGTGLGLAITRQLVQQLNGEIMVESAPGAGATFTVFLERTRGMPAAPAPTSHQPISTMRLRVLLVDDDPFFPPALARALGRQFELQTARSAAEAKTLLHDDKNFDAVLVDVIMPDMDGVGFFTWLSRQHPALRTRVIFLTGGVTGRALTESLEATLRPCLTKPVDQQELVALIRSLAREERTSHEGVDPASQRTAG